MNRLLSKFIHFKINFNHLVDNFSKTNPTVKFNIFTSFRVTGRHIHFLCSSAFCLNASSLTFIKNLILPSSSTPRNLYRAVYFVYNSLNSRENRRGWKCQFYVLTIEFVLKIEHENASQIFPSSSIVRDKKWDMLLILMKIKFKTHVTANFDASSFIFLSLQPTNQPRSSTW